METTLEKSTWVKAAELFFDNNDVLKVNIVEREPIARVFTTTGTTFYIDSSDMMLPLSDKFPARLPVFTNFPSDKVVLAKADSNLLNDVKTLSLAIQQDTFCMALIDQIDITPNRTFEMMPKIGNQVIVFGDASDVQEKFYKLKLFYKEVMTKTNWNKYSTINVQYKGQVVAKIKGAEEKTADSLRMQQNMELLVQRSQQQAADTTVQNRIPDNDRSATTDSTMIERSIERNDDGQNAAADDDKPAAENKPTIDKPIVPKPVVAKPAENHKPAAAKPVTVKPIAAKPIKPVEQPKPKPVAKPPAAKPKPKPTKPNNDY
jgi:cell division protein FtsQ